MAAKQDSESTRNVIATNDTMDKPSIITSGVNLYHHIFCMMMRSVMVTVYGRHGKSMPQIDDSLLLDSASALAEKIRTNQVTATEVMNAFIKRIKQINPLLNCVIDERYKDALEEAAEVDRLIASNKFSVDELKERKPFLGVPMSSKDPIGVKGMIQSAGLWFRQNERCAKDSDVIHLMREAGAIPFVTTNIPELCMGWESYNKVFGRSLNPYDTTRIVGGSSGGEGCLQAAAGSPFGLGSDIGGSIRIPAFFNGIFGHMPSPLIVSNAGHFPKCISTEEKFATRIGPLCRYACDLKPILKIIAGDKVKELNLDNPVNLSSLKCFYQYDDGGALFVSSVDNDIRIGLDKVVAHFNNALNVKPQEVKMTKLRDSVLLWAANVTDDRHGVFEWQLANQNGRLNPYTELLKWFMGLSKHTLYALITAFRSRWGIQFGTPVHRLKVEKCNELRREFEEMLGDSGVFLYPTHPTVAPYHTEPFLKDYNFSYAGIFNVLGFPSTTCPLGLGNEGLPIGIQVVANRNQDRLCLAVAGELERAFGGWVAPDIKV